MTDRITAILDLIHEAKVMADGGTESYSYRVATAYEEIRTSVPPDFAKLVVEALPCPWQDPQMPIDFNNPCPSPDRNQHAKTCPAYYRHAVIELLGAILTNERMKERFKL